MSKCAKWVGWGITYRYISILEVGFRISICIHIHACVFICTCHASHPYAPTRLRTPHCAFKRQYSTHPFAGKTRGGVHVKITKQNSALCIAKSFRIQPNIANLRKVGRNRLVLFYFIRVFTHLCGIYMVQPADSFIRGPSMAQHKFQWDPES